jgi:hypothetical protein
MANKKIETTIKYLQRGTGRDGGVVVARTTDGDFRLDDMLALELSGGLGGGGTIGKGANAVRTGSRKFDGKRVVVEFYRNEDVVINIEAID